MSSSSTIWHTFIQDYCSQTHLLLDNLQKLEREGAIRADQVSFFAQNAIEIMSRLQEWDKISNLSEEHPLSEIEISIISKLMDHGKMQHQAVAKVINPILHARYTKERESVEPEAQEEEVEFQEPYVDEEVTRKYNALYQEIRQKLNRLEPIEDRLFEELEGYYLQMTGIFKRKGEAPSRELFQWHLHYSLLKSSYDRAVLENNIPRQKTINFLIVQYLATAASVHFDEYEEKDKPQLQNVGLQLTETYHRSQFSGYMYEAAHKELTKKLNSSIEYHISISFLIDSAEIGDLFSLNFHVVDAESQTLHNALTGEADAENALIQEWARKMEEGLSQEIEEGADCRIPLKQNLLFDFTEIVEKELAFVEGDREAQRASLQTTLRKMQTLWERAVSVASSRIKQSHPQILLGELELNCFIKKNCRFVSRGTLDGIPYISEIKIFHPSPVFERILGHIAWETNVCTKLKVLSEGEDFIEVPRATFTEATTKEYCGQPTETQILPHVESEKEFVDRVAAEIVQRYSGKLHELQTYHFGRPLCIDFTEYVQGKALTPERQKDLKRQFSVAIARATQKLLEEEKFLETIDKEMLELFIRKYLICFYQTSDAQGQLNAIMLKMFDESVLKQHMDPMIVSQFSSGMFGFIVNSGLAIGAVRLRHEMSNIEGITYKNLMEAGGSKYYKEVEYAPRGNEDVVYFPRVEDLVRLRTFDTLRRRIDLLSQQQFPQVHIMGKATIDVCQGFLNEIAQQLKDEGFRGGERPLQNLYNDPIVQTTLYRLLQHLATAENNAADSAKFLGAIELAHAELGTLLSLFAPFAEGEFSSIYQNQLTHIPHELQGCVQVGLGKSAMNVFMGVRHCVAQTLPEGQKKTLTAFGEGLYYEVVHELGENRITEKVLQNNETSLDLYMANANPNINVNPGFIEEYASTKVIEEVETLLAQKKETTHLTVAIDCTIDFVQSEKGRALLEHFKEQILSGKLNFVFFRSGQKFDMLGHDNYYGAPFYVINNGDDHWKPFKELTTREAFQTDPISQQWFCLGNKYAFEQMEEYRRTVFTNARNILDRMPPSLKPGGGGKVHVCTADPNMDVTFIHIKFKDSRLQESFNRALEKAFAKKGLVLFTRDSFGFPHTNVRKIYKETRITPGLDPREAETVIEVLTQFAAENP